LKRILAINPNTTEAITKLVTKHLRDAVSRDIEIIPVTGPFGAPYISSEASYAIAGHAALRSLQDASSERLDCVLLACFGDPGLFALREVAEVPVVGLAEASMQEAAERPGSFSIVTGGRRWQPMLERLALELGFAPKLASIRPIRLTGAEMAASPDAAIELLAVEVRAARERDGAGAVILGGAGLAGLGERVAQASGVAVIDSVAAGARRAEALARSGKAHYSRLSPEIES
jgi:Asp/Glu/hydantoin racemase